MIRTKELVLCAMFTALTCAAAMISVPLPGGVPVTMQTAAVMLTGFLLGWKAGGLSALIYLLLGMAGLPVFAGFTGGIAKLAGPTGGFLVGLPLLAAVCGAAYDRYGRAASGRKKYAVMAAAMLAGNVILYALGLGWFMRLMQCSFERACVLCMLPFIPGDCLKMVLAALLVPRLERAVRPAEQNR